MVVGVSFRFLINIAPTGVDAALNLVIQCATGLLFRAYMNITQYINHNMNGVLYSIVGCRFRTDLLNLCFRKDKCEDISTSHSINSNNVRNISGIRA